MKKFAPLVVLALVFTAGCDDGIYRILYNSLNMIIYRSVTRYVEPTPEQERILKQKIDQFLQWHRRSELPKYIVTLRGVRERASAGITEADVKWMQARFEQHGADLFNATADDTVAFLESLDRKQIEKMDAAIGDSIAEIEKESQKSGEERARAMERSTVRIMEFIYGDLSRRQKDDVGRLIRAGENIDAERIRMYRERRAAFIALLKSKPGPAALKEYLAAMMINPERSYPAYYRAPAERRDRMTIDAFLRFERELVSPEQRAHAVKRIDMLIRVLDGLSKQ